MPSGLSLQSAQQHNNIANARKSSTESLSQQLQDAISKNASKINKNLSLPKEIVNSPLPNGELPLHFAIRQEARAVVELLLNHPEIDLNQQDNQGLGISDHLFLMNNQEFKAFVLGLFCKKTIDNAQEISKSYSTDQLHAITREIAAKLVFTSNATPFHSAVVAGNLQELDKMVLSGVDLNEQSVTGHTALSIAVSSGKLPVVKWLVDHGARTDLLSKQKVSPLHVAALHGHNDIIKLLIEKGVNPNTNDDRSYTPLHYAILGGDIATMRLLIEKGADPLTQTAGITPLALLSALAKNLSTERDPLKLGLLQELMCLCTLATWIQSYFGNEMSLLTSLIQATSSVVFSFTALNQLVSNHKFSSSVVAWMMCIFPVDSFPVIGEASLAVRTFFVTQSVWQGLQVAWRNRKLDPYKALRNVFVHATNAAFSVWNIQQKVKKIWNNYSLNYSLKQDVEAHLAKKDCEAAFKTASTMHWYPAREETLGNIVEQCHKTDRVVAHQAISLMSVGANRDAGLKSLTNHLLSKDNCEGALGTTSQMSSYTGIDDALSTIVSKCLEKQPDVAEQAVSKMYSFTSTDEALRTIADHHLNQENCEGALKAVSKMYSYTGIDDALSTIVSKCLEKQPDVAEQAVSKMYSFTSTDEALRTIADHHLNQENCEGALKAVSKMYSFTSTDEALSTIVSKCLEKQPDVAEKAVSKMYSFTSTDEALRTIADHHLKQENCERALKAVSKMYSFTGKDEALRTIADHHLKQENCSEALKAASKLSYVENEMQALKNVASNPVCQEKHKPVVEEASNRIESLVYRRKIISYIGKASLITIPFLAVATIVTTVGKVFHRYLEKLKR